ncbi:MAG TPA: tetratricopeptide repeat protein, partial [Pirellulales bacterium]|nr:tetratricopeptide repeat protein [Pirellulales bacterium]
EYLLVSKNAQALARLDEIKETALSDRDLAPKVVMLYERAGKPDDADGVVDLLRDRDPDGSAATLLSADLLMQRKRPDEAAKLLNEALLKLQGGARRDVLFSLAQVHLASEDRELAEQRFAELAEENKEQEIIDVRPVQQLAELALKTADLAKAKKWEDELKRMEGWHDDFRRGDGTSWRFFQAQRLVLETRSDHRLSAAEKGRMLREADALQQEIERLRPAWPPGFTLKAKLALNQKNNEEAINAYEQAIKLGEASVDVYGSLIYLLATDNRVEDAARYLAKLREAVSVPSELVPLAISIDAKQGEKGLDSAIRLADNEIAKNPDDVEMRLRRGYLLSLNSGDEEAKEKANEDLKIARKLAPGDTRALSTLFLFFVKTHQFDDAKELLASLEAATELAGDDRALFLAQGYAALKDVEKAKTHYLEAVGLAQGRPDVLLQAAGFFFDREPKRAESCLRRVLELSDSGDAKNRQARQTLALLLEMHREVVTDPKEIERLLGADRAGDAPDDPADRRLRAVLLIKRGGSENRKKAQSLLEALVANPQDTTATDRLWLARIYEAQGNMSAAREQMQRLVNSGKPTPEHLAAYVDFQLRAGNPSDAADRLEKLARVEPEKDFFRTLSLRARWLKDKDLVYQIAPKVEAFVEAQTAGQVPAADQARLLADVANLYASLDMPDAEEYFHRAFDLDRSTHPALATWLVKQHRAKEAFELCLKVNETDDTPFSAMTLFTVMALSKPDTSDRAIAQKVLDRAMDRFPRDADLAFAASTWKLMEGEDDDAIKLLNQVLDKQPNHRPALNNLAMLLSSRPDRRAEALEKIERAIDLAGEVPELVDSKGWILLQPALATDDSEPNDPRRNDVLNEARKRFEEATMLPPGDPRHWFHLALVYHLQDDPTKARWAWKQVGNRGFDRTTLIPREQDEWDKLERAL